MKKGLFMLPLLLMAFVMFAGCSDQNVEDVAEGKIVYPSVPSDPVLIQNAEGVLYASEDGKTWEVRFDMDEYSHLLNRSFGDEESAIVFVNNLKDQYKIGGTKVIVSGTAQYQYRIVYGFNTTMPIDIYYFSLDLTNIELLSR